MTGIEMLDAMRTMLEPISSRLDTMQSQMDTMQSQMDTMQSQMDTMQEDVTDIKQRVLVIELTLENDIARNINLLAEGHCGLAEKLKGLDPLTEKVEDIQNTVDVLKFIAVKK